MTTGEMAYLALVLFAFVGFATTVAYATWRTEGPPAWLARRRAPSVAPSAGRGLAAATRAR
jgi:hypothetical protein